MKKIIAPIERFSVKMGGRMTFKFEFAKSELFGSAESHPCEQQKLMIPAELQTHAIPAFIITSTNIIFVTNGDDLWNKEIIQMEQALDLKINNEAL